jgi:hypothetical protein
MHFSIRFKTFKKILKKENFQNQGKKMCGASVRKMKEK